METIVRSLQQEGYTMKTVRGRSFLFDHVLNFRRSRG